MVKEEIKKIEAVVLYILREFREGVDYIKLLTSSSSDATRDSQSKLCLSSRCSLGSKSCTLPRRTSC